MAVSLNEVNLIGNVGRDPEIKSTNSGMRIANLSLATSESWTDKGSGEKKERTEWHRISIINDNLVGIVDKYVRKGSRLFVRGQLSTRKWTDQSGQERYTTEVVLRFDGRIILLGDPGGGNRPPPAEESDYGGRSSGGGSARTTRQNDLDDEIPFATNDVAAEPYLKRRIVV